MRTISRQAGSARRLDRSTIHPVSLTRAIVAETNAEVPLEKSPGFDPRAIAERSLAPEVSFVQHVLSQSGAVASK